jgi:hypothetical protein
MDLIETAETATLDLAEALQRFARTDDTYRARVNGNVFSVAAQAEEAARLLAEAAVLLGEILEAPEA